MIFDLNERMENGLIALLMPMTAKMMKEAMPQIDTENTHIENTLNFIDLLGVSMNDGSVVLSKILNYNPAEINLPDQNEMVSGDTSSTAGKSLILPDTQSLIALLQNILMMQNQSGVAPQPGPRTDIQRDDENMKNRDVTEFTRNIVALLKHGEIVRITIRKQDGQVDTRPEYGSAEKKNDSGCVLREFPIAEKQPAPSGISIEAQVAGHMAEYPETEEAERTVTRPDTDVIALIAAALQQMGYSAHENVTTKNLSDMCEAAQDKAEIPDRELPGIYRIIHDKPGAHVNVQKTNHNTPEITTDSRGSTYVASDTPEWESSPLQKNGSTHQSAEITIEVIKPVEKPVISDTAIQRITMQNEDDHRAASAYSHKMEFEQKKRIEEQVVIVRGTDEADERDISQDRQLPSGNDVAKMNHRAARETGKPVEKSSFTSVMMDRIEKITEQFAGKNTAFDMVVRLKVDERESLIVGFKDHGQRISVEIKTTNENTGSILQSQKEEIMKQLEEKDVYTNIYVDIHNEKRERKEQKDGAKKRSSQNRVQDFSGFLNEVA